MELIRQMRQITLINTELVVKFELILLISIDLDIDLMNYVSMMYFIFVCFLIGQVILWR